ncbi:MAG: hypothetical protein D6704_00655 [Nitrospirae bacterium]|nr:MAG: hypothetical protein D6704_00655 [Nitrospirota bacterium]
MREIAKSIRQAIKPIHLVLGGLLLVAGLASWFGQPGKPSLPQDPNAVKAMQLVQQHPARQAQTIQQAIDDYIAKREAQGRTLWVGQWRVTPEGQDTYIVSILIREKESSEWIERDFAWRVNLRDQSLRVVTLPASQFMPFHELPPLPYQSEASP